MIAAATNTNKVKYRNGNTTDIMHEVVDCFKDSHTQVADFASQLKGRTVEDTCNNVWSFIKHNITYKIDPAGVQWIKTPARLWSDKNGDCKSFSVMAASLLAHNGITPTFRFTSYSRLDNTPTHVYVVVKQPNKKEIIIDAVYTGFNQQKPYTFKKDYTMTKISRLSGLEETQITMVSSPASRAAAAQLQKLISDRDALIAANNYTAKDAALYNKWIGIYSKKLDKAAGANVSGIAGIGDVLEAGAELGGAVSLIGPVLDAIKSVLSFFGGPSDGEKRKEEFDKKGISVDDIAKYYILNRANFGQFNDWQLNEFNELYAQKAPQQGHNWTDRTNEIKLSTAKAYNAIVNSHRPNSYWDAIVLDESKTIKDTGGGIIPDTPAPPKTAEELQQAQTTKTILGIAAAGAFALLR